MRRFYLMILSHLLGTYAMPLAVWLTDTFPGRRHSVDAHDIVFLVLSPLLSWYVLLESITRFPLFATSVVWLSYLCAAVPTYLLSRRLWPRPNVAVTRS